MNELFVDNMECAKELAGIISKFHATVGDAYVELLQDLAKYGQDPKNVELYNTAGYALVVKPVIGALYSTEKTINNLLENFYKKS